MEHCRSMILLPTLIVLSCLNHISYALNAADTRNVVLKTSESMGNDKNKEHEKHKDFYEWLLSNDGGNVKQSLADKLIANGIDSMNVLESIGDDLENVAEELNLSALQKVKLRAIINNLPNRYTIIDKDETEAIAKMHSKVAEMQSSIKLISDTKQGVDNEVLNHTKTITLTFKRFHELLNKREAELIKQLNEIANEKKTKLDNVLQILTQQSSQSEQQLIQCHKRLKKSIGLDGIEERKKDILSIAKSIGNISVVNEENQLIRNSQMFTVLNEDTMNRTINSFGTVYGASVPLL
eukprot:47104_1